MEILQSSEQIQKFQPLSVLNGVFPVRGPEPMTRFPDVELLQSGGKEEG